MNVFHFCRPDPGLANAARVLFSCRSLNSNTPATSAGGSRFGSARSFSSAPVGSCVLEVTSTVSSSTFGSSAQSRASQSLAFGQGTKPATTRGTGKPGFLRVLGPGASRNRSAASGFHFGARTTAGSAGSFGEEKTRTLYADCLSSEA